MSLSRIDALLRQLVEAVGPTYAETSEDVKWARESVLHTYNSLGQKNAAQLASFIDPASVKTSGPSSDIDGRWRFECKIRIPKGTKLADISGKVWRPNGTTWDENLEELEYSSGGGSGDSPGRAYSNWSASVESDATHHVVSLSGDGGMDV